MCGSGVPNKRHAHLFESTEHRARLGLPSRAMPPVRTDARPSLIQHRTGITLNKKTDYVINRDQKGKADATPKGTSARSKDSNVLPPVG